MAFEAISAVQSAEERAAALKLQAEQAAAEAVERAERDGKAAVEAAAAKAESELNVGTRFIIALPLFNLE